jgi:hypothetical protein
LNLLQKDTIIVVNDTVDLGVTGVGFHSHEFLGQFLVKVDLAGLDDAAVVDRAVLCDGPIGVDLDMDVQGSADLEDCVVNRGSLNRVSGRLGGGMYIEAWNDAVE